MYTYVHVCTYALHVRGGEGENGIVVCAHMHVCMCVCEDYEEADCVEMIRRNFEVRP